MEDIILTSLNIAAIVAFVAQWVWGMRRIDRCGISKSQPRGMSFIGTIFLFPSLIMVDEAKCPDKCK